MNNKILAEKALNIAKNMTTSYLLGSFGHVASKSNLNRLLNQYPENYNWVGKAQEIIGQGFYFDCCGLLKSLAWNFSGDLEKVYGGATYASNNVADCDANTMCKNGIDVSTDFSNIMIGEAVWMNNHIGIYCGNNIVVEATPSFGNGVLMTALLNKSAVSGLNGRIWTKHFKLPWVDYSFATSTENILPSGQSTQVAFAQYFDKSLANTYKVSTGGYGLNLRKDASQSATIIKAFADGTQATCYGYYSVDKSTGIKWYLVAVNGYKGFMSSEYLI